MKVKLIIAVLIIVGIFAYIIKKNNEDSSRLMQVAEAHQQRLEKEKSSEEQAKKSLELQSVQAEKLRVQKTEQDKLNNQKQAQEFERAQQFKIQAGIKKIEGKVKAGLLDPEAAKFRNIKGNCGELNAKNKMGGYTGYRRFIYNPSYDTVSVEDENDGLYNPKMMDILWDAQCS